MKTANKYKKELEIYAGELEKRQTKIFADNLDARILNNWHKMIVEGKDCLENVYQDLEALVKVDLIDFFCLEKNGRADKKG